MAEVHFETDAETSISDAAVKYAERHAPENDDCMEKNKCSFCDEFGQFFPFEYIDDNVKKARPVRKPRKKTPNESKDDYDNYVKSLSEKGL